MLTLERLRSAVHSLISKERALSRIRASATPRGISNYYNILRELERPSAKVASFADLLKVKYVGHATAARILEELGELREEVESAESSPAGVEMGLPDFPRTEKELPRKPKRATFTQIAHRGEIYRVPALFSVCQAVLLLFGEIANEGAGEFTDALIPSLSVLKYSTIQHIRRRQEVYCGMECITQCTEKSIKDAVKWLKRNLLVHDSGSESVVPTDKGLNAAALLEEFFRARPSREGGGGAFVYPGEDRAQGGPAVKLIVDNREKKGRRDPSYFQGKLSILGLPTETRQLTLSDFVWVREDGGSELFAGALIERKTVGDLLSSLRDGRYREQSHRLAKIEGAAKIYLIEGAVPSNPPVLSAVFTVILDLALSGFLVLKTDAIEDTVYHLYMAHRIICGSIGASSGGALTLSDVLRRSERKRIEGLGPREMAVVQMQAIRGVSQSMAEAIVGELGTVHEIIELGDRSAPSLFEKLSAVRNSAGGKMLGRRKAGRILSGLGVHFVAKS